MKNFSQFACVMAVVVVGVASMPLPTTWPSKERTALIVQHVRPPRSYEETKALTAPRFVPLVGQDNISGVSLDRCLPVVLRESRAASKTPRFRSKHDNRCKNGNRKDRKICYSSCKKYCRMNCNNINKKKFSKYINQAVRKVCTLFLIAIS